MLTGRVEFQNSQLTYKDGLLIREVIDGVGETDYKYINADQVEKTRLKSKEEHICDSFVFTNYFYDDELSLIQEIETIQADGKDIVIKVKSYKYSISKSTGKRLNTCDIATVVNGKPEKNTWTDCPNVTCARYKVAAVDSDNSIKVTLDIDTSQLDAALSKAQQLNEVILNGVCGQSILKSILPALKCHND